MNNYKRAVLNLQAFEVLEGFGSQVPNKEGKHGGPGFHWEKWGFERRKEEALKLVEWALESKNET